MNRLLFLTSVTFSHMGGMEIYNDQLASALGAQLNGQVYMLPVNDRTPVKTPGADYQLLSLGLLHQLPSHTLRDHLLYRGARWLASRAIASHHLDFILCGHVHLLPLAAELSRLHQLPYAIIGHGIEMWSALAPAKVEALRHAEWGIAVSRFTAEKMAEKGLARHKISILPPHVDTHFFVMDKGLGKSLRQKRGWNGKKVLLTVGRLAADERYKGHDTVIQALRLALPAQPDLLYVIAGDGDDRPRLEALTADYGLQDHVQFLGYVPEEDKVALYNACDVFIMVSQANERDNRWVGEGFGIVFLEANACGKAVIGPDVGGALDAIEDGVSGLLVSPDDVSAVSRAILALAGDPVLCRQLGEQGRQRAERRFSLEMLNHQVGELLHELFQRTVAV